MDLRFNIENITYQNNDNGYTVLQACNSETNRRVCVTGTFANIRQGMEILAEGEWFQHPRFGKQFKAQTWQEILPNTVLGLEKYLASGLIRGIGPKYAKIIVKKFGMETMEIIDKHVERLLEVKGIGRKRVEIIRDSWVKHHAIKNIMIFLEGFGISPAYAVKIFKKYGDNSIKTVKENPYQLTEDIDGIGFKIADSVALNMGYTKDDWRRCTAGVLYNLKQFSMQGHCFATEEQLLKDTTALLEVKDEGIMNAVAQLEFDNKIIIDDDKIYLPMYFHAERYVARKLKQLNEHRVTWLPSIDINCVCPDSGITFDPIQERAILSSLKSRVMILTGGPGTGKTTTTKGIIDVITKTKCNVLLAAPTGRAAKRMKESTGLEAKTIHRLLEFSPQEGYQRNEENPLKGDVLIIDECSMIDILLMNSLLRAVPLGMRLILIGDTDQLPSVGAGNVLNDIINSHEFNVIKLKTVFRQAQTSNIIMGAHAINAGRMPDTSNGNKSDLFFIEAAPDEDIADKIVSLVTSRLPNYYHVNTSDIQVLSPMRRGNVGTEELNRRLQDALNPEGNAITYLGKTYRIKDKVMQVKNNYDKGVFNGDIGYITMVDKEDRKVTAEFDGNAVEYEDYDLDELVPAYACTIHKSQGSEFPIVVMPVTMGHYIMLQRNLIYTGITRSKKICVMIGEKNALAYAVRNNTVRHRNTNLKEIICNE